MTTKTGFAPDPSAERKDLTNTVAILAPRGRDAAVARKLLEDDGNFVVLADGLAHLARLIEDHVGAILITEEALSGAGSAKLEAALDEQPAWSDVPFVVLANGTTQSRSSRAAAKMDRLRNAVLLSRPLHAEEVLRSVRSALKARQRQHEARGRMEELQLRERQLRESEAKFHAIADSVDQMIWSTRPDGFHDYYNKRWYDYTGVPEGSTDGEAWNGMFHADDQQRAWDTWNHSLETGEAYEIEYRLRHRSGQYRWVLGRAQPVRDSFGNIIRWYGTCTDIHDEVLLQESTVEGLTRQRDVMWNLAVDLIVVASEEGKILSLNDAWTRILGFATEELTAEKLGELIHPDDREETQRIFESVFQTPLIEPYEYRLSDSEGNYRWFAWTASANDGQVHAIGRDVTEQKAKAAALAEAEEALRQSQKLEMIGQLTGGVAHDFNNLLMAIRSSLDLLKRRLPETDARTQSLIGNASEATERGAALTQRMLAFARRQELHAESVDMATVVPGLRDLLARSIGPQIEIVIDVEENVPNAAADLNQLEMAILNLVVNARDAMDGKGTLTLAVKATDGTGISGLNAGRYVTVSVSDTGTGMDAATLAQATEPFFTTKGIGKGTGLGLSMIHGLALQSGGTFVLESELGRGTVATLYLPALDEEASRAPAAEPEAEPEIAAAQENRDPRKLVILAVDDDILVSMGTVGILEDLGHEVIEVHSGEAALKALEDRSDINFLLTDQAMPKMTGVELARKVRDQRPDMPVVLATGYAELPEGAESLISARLEKPFSDIALENVLKSFQ